MYLLASSPFWVLALLCALLLAAAIQDAVQLRISNLISGSIFLLAFVAAALSPGGIELEFWRNLAFFAAVLAIGTGLYSRSILGGGDVKLFAAVAMWAGDLVALSLLAAILMAGGVLAISIIAMRTLLPTQWTKPVKTLQRGAGIPYGVAIALGTIAIMASADRNSAPQTYNPNLDSLDRE